MKISELFEDRDESTIENTQVIAIFPGRFQPPTPAHIAVYQQLISKFSADNVFITMTNVIDPTRSPLSYDERKHIFTTMLSLPTDKILLVKNQYNVEQLQKILHLNDNDAIVFAVGQKDMEDNPRFNIKSSDSYVQKYDPSNLKPFTEHMYIYAPKTKQFTISNKSLKSATEIRKIFKMGDEDQQKQAFIDMYGVINEPIFRLLKQKLS